MNTLPLNEPAGVLVKTTGVDFPGRIAGSFFLRGCNLRCPYCYNTDLVIKTTAQNQNTENSQSKLNTIQELFDHLEKRQGILSGLVISGGTALLNGLREYLENALNISVRVAMEPTNTVANGMKILAHQLNSK
jgi:pyruvate formate lyase activating enzyme